MKVKELIEELEKQNPDANVKIVCDRGHEKDADDVKGNPLSCVVEVKIS